MGSDYRETKEGKRRFGNPEIYQKTLEFQQYLRSKGIAWHNFYSDECTIDFDCCEEKIIGKIPRVIKFPQNRILLKDFSNKLFEEIKHGDKEHEEWLERKIMDFTDKYNNGE